MGIYTEVLREREKKDSALALAAEDSLRQGRVSINASNEVENVHKAILEILKRYGRNPHEVRSCKNTEELLNAILDPEDILYEKTDMTDSGWRSQSNLILAFDRDSYPVVIYPGIVGFCFYRPISGKKGLVTKKLGLKKDGYIIFRPLSGDGFSIKSFLLLMLKLISPRDVILIAAASLLVSLLGLVAPNINKSVLSNVMEMGEGAMPYLFGSAVVFITAGLAKGFFGVVKTFLLGNTKQRISAQLQTAIMGKLLMMPYEYFETGTSGKLSNQIRSGKRLSDMLIDMVLNSMMGMAFSLVYIPQMYSLAPALLAPALMILIIQIALSIVLTLLSAKYTAKKINIQQDMETHMFEVLKGIQKIFNIGAGKRVYARTAERYGTVLSAELNPPKYILLKDVILGFVSSMGSVIILITAALASVSQADYIAFCSSFGLLSSSVSLMVSMTNNMVSMHPLYEQLRNLFDFSGSERGVEFVSDLKGEIEIDSLCYSYIKGERGCVDNVSLHITPGEKIAFVGESGCGKSTLLKLMLGMISPDSGTILYDGKPLPTLNKRSLRRKIGSVFQFTRVFPGTIFDNIAFTSKGLTEEDAWEAARKAAIADDIEALPMGMETEITEGNGGGFSGGQKQRLMIARAFAQKPSIMILDEATSALDNISQHEVLQSVYKLKCTVIMVAHRLSTIKDCDRIVVFQNGNIVEEGNYDELMGKNAAFAKLVKKQQLEK